jgi:hypothetical protein
LTAGGQPRLGCLFLVAVPAQRPQGGLRMREMDLGIRLHEPPRCVSRLGVDRPGILVSIAMVAVID